MKHLSYRSFVFNTSKISSKPCISSISRHNLTLKVSTICLTNSQVFIFHKYCKDLTENHGADEILKVENMLDEDAERLFGI